MWSQQAALGNSQFLSSVAKDESVMINNFDAAHRLLNHGAKNLNERYPRFRDKLDLFFIDHEWVPLLIQDNYLNSMEKKDTAQDIEAMANASEFISLGDSLNRQIRVNMDWSLLPNYGVCSSIAPCLILKGKSFYPRFPEWLGKNSSQRKSHRQIKELKFAMGSSVQCDYAAIHLEVVPLILLQLHILI
jgi:replication factor C subunit 1